MNYSQINVSGPDAMTFLQGQLSNDMHLLGERPQVLAAWCNPKGRVITLLRVARIGNDYALGLPEDIADTVVRRLGMFRFRAKVDFERAALGAQVIGTDSADSATIDNWRIDNLRRGIPEIALSQSEAFTPHMLNLDKLDALSFDKGCYTGQEIVARTHYRGASRRRMLRFESSEPVSAGNEVLAGDRKIGDVVNAIGRDLLAVVPLDSADGTLTIAGATVTRSSLPYELH